MAAPVITALMNNVTLADDLTNWAGFNDGGGGAGTDVLEQDIFIQGIAAVSKKVSGTSQDQGLIYTPGGSVDLSAAADAHVYAWIAFTTHGILATIAGGGIYIRLGDGTNWSKWYIDGSDTIPADTLFKRYVIDTRKVESENSGTPCDLTAVTTWAVGVNSTGNSKSENLIVDRIDYGTGLRIDDGDATDPCTWQALFDDDDDVNNKYGIITQRSGVFYMKGALAIGDPTSKTTLWLDTSGSQVVFEAPQYHNGAALVSAVGDDLYAITFQGNGTGTTDITFGQVLGSGDDRQGINGGNISAVRPVHFSVDGETDIADLDTVNLYGLTFTRAGTTTLSGSTKTDVIGCQFINCGEVECNDAEFLNNTIIASSPDHGVEMVASHNIKQVGFIAGDSAAQPADRAWQVDESITPDAFVEYTAEFEDVAIGNVIPFPATEAINDYFAIGLVQKFEGLTVDTDTARSGGTLVWEYWNGSAWSTLTTLTDATNTLSTLGSQTVTWRTPIDWAAVSLNGEWPMFYVRLRVTATMTTNPILGEGRVDDPVEHAVHVPVAGTYTFDALEFFGFAPDGAPKWHTENSAAATVLETYADSNRDGSVTFTGAGNNRRAQEIIGNGEVLTRVMFTLQRAGTLTGDMVCELYDSDDASPAIPTGAILATSEPVAASSVASGAMGPIDFQFKDEVTLTNTQTYFVAIFYVAAGGGTLSVGRDSGGATADGTRADFADPTWTGFTGQALAGFDIWTSGLLIINASNGANPTEAEADNTGDPAGVTIVNNPITYTIDGLIAGSEVRIFTDPAGVELAGIESSGTSFAYPYNYGGDIDVYVIIQNLNYKWRRVDDTLTNTDKTIPANQLPDPDYLI